MMIEIGISNIHKNYGYNQVLGGLSFEVMTGERVALVGKNGSGKTTLLHIITGEEPPDRGAVSVRRGARIGFLAQIPQLWPPGTTARDVLRHAFAPLEQMESEMRALEHEMARDGADLERLYGAYTRLQDRFVALGGYDMDEQMSRVTHGFGIEPLLGTPFNELSGGEKTIICMASMVLTQPDILLLDEPTNHLDMDAMNWFAAYLREYRGSVLIISHDRYFLDRVATKTVMLYRGEGRVYHGNYSFAVSEQERETLEEFKDYKDQQKQIAAMRDAIRRFRDWGARGDNEMMFHKAKTIERRLEKMEKLDNPYARPPALRLAFGGERTSRDVIRTRGLCLTVPGRVLANDLTFTVQGGDRMLLAGKNGTGKTTLLRAIIENAPGVTVSPSSHIGYIPQEIRFPDDNQTLLAFYRSQQTMSEGEGRQSLARYGFYSDSVFKKLKMLSGGEKVLLLLAVQVMLHRNVLILDEPTNHLGIDTRETLEEALSDYRGTLLFVSHDLYFIRRLATRVLELQSGELRERDVAGYGE